MFYIVCIVSKANKLSIIIKDYNVGKANKLSILIKIITKKSCQMSHMIIDELNFKSSVQEKPCMFESFTGMK